MKVGWISFGSISLPCRVSTSAAQSSSGSASSPASSASSSRLASVMSTPVSSSIASRRRDPRPGRARSRSSRRRARPSSSPAPAATTSADELLGDVHHAVVVDAADEPLEHRELGVVLGRHPLVAEELAELVDVLEAADDRPLQVQLGRDPQEEVAVERVVVGLERPRRGAAGQPLQDRRFQLDVAALVHVVADRRQHLGAQLEDLARALVRHQVELALAVAGLGVGDAVEEVGRVAQRLGEQHALAHLDRELAALGHVEVALDADDVADVEVFDPVERLLAERRRRGRRPGSSRRGRGRRRRTSCRGRAARSPGRRSGRSTLRALPHRAAPGRGRRGSRRSGSVRRRSGGRDRFLPLAAAQPWRDAPPRSTPWPDRPGWTRARRSRCDADCHTLTTHVVAHGIRVAQHLPHRRAMMGVVLERHSHS